MSSLKLKNYNIHGETVLYVKTNRNRTVYLSYIKYRIENTYDY